MARPVSIPTEHDKREWSRLAQAAYQAGRNALGHRASASAALPRGAEMHVRRYDSLMELYRAWLVRGWPGVDELERRGNPLSRAQRAVKRLAPPAPTPFAAGFLDADDFATLDQAKAYAAARYPAGVPRTEYLDGWRAAHPLPNPTRWHVAIRRGQAGPVLTWNGHSFANTGRSRAFSSEGRALAAAKALRRRHARRLSAYRMWVARANPAPNGQRAAGRAYAEFRATERQLEGVARALVARLGPDGALTHQRAELARLPAGSLGHAYAATVLKMLEKLRRENPAALERCVRAVEAKRRPRGKPVQNAYAVCTAALKKRRRPRRPGARRRANPSGAESVQLDQAAQKLQDFTGHRATRVERTRARSTEKTGLVIGELDLLGYIAKRDGRTERYGHRFRKRSRPLLAVSTDGKQLHIVGGRYEFTDAGIEDR